MATMFVQIDQGLWEKQCVSFEAFFHEFCASWLLETEVSSLIFPFADAFAPVTGAT